MDAFFYWNIDSRNEKINGDAMTMTILIVHLGIELSQKIKVLLEVCGQDCLNDKEAETLEFNVIQVGQEVVLGLGQVEAPGRCSVVVL